ncbi:MAG: tetratricopeptide repeat protein [Methanocorpusculum sp.]|nr:tetratricopeptide repeat protein [Methanocorpusculum sp.]
MRVSEGNLTQQYYCDYLTILAEEIFSATETEAVRKSVHENIVFRNLFLHRMSVDGGFHARVVSAILRQPDDSRVLMDLLAVAEQADVDALPVEEWLKREYASAVEVKNGARMIAVEALLRSYISGTNQAAEIIASAGDSHPLSWWQLETRRITVAEVANPDMYFGVGRRPFWHEFPLDRYAAVAACVPDLPPQEIYDCVVCIAGAWFSSLTHEEMIAWLNMPHPTLSEWETLCAPLLKCETPDAALSTANWLYASGNNDPAMDLYANITLAFPGTSAEISSFELIGTILRKSGDFDNAFEAYKSAFIASRGAGGYQTAIGLKNLCEVGEDLGEDMSEYYTRIAGIADMLPMPEKLRLYLELAASCRRRRAYEEEYRYLEQVIDAEDGDEGLVSAAMSRLSEMNSCLSADGKPDAVSLAARDTETESAVAVTRGTAAYFGFDPVCALEWYGRSGSPDVLSLQFSAAMAAGADAGEYARTPAQRAVVLAGKGVPVMEISRELNTAVTNAWQEGGDVSAVIEPVIPYLSPENLGAVLAAVTARSTRDDERAIVCSAASQALLSAGRADEARSMLRAALRANPGREMRARLFAELGWLEYEAGAFAAAADACDAALKIHDQFPAAWACRARALAGMGRYDEAFSASGYAVGQNPSNASYQHLRAALGIVSASPVDPCIDLMFVLPEPGCLQAAAARYTVRKTGACPPVVWDVSGIEDVIPMRV